MIIKNVSGVTKYFAAGGKGINLANNATGTVPDTNKAYRDVSRAVARKELEIIKGFQSDEVIRPIDIPEGYRVDVSTVADGNFITIAGVTFEFDNNAAVTAGNTLVTFSSDATALTNLKAAINANAVLKEKKIFATDINTTVKFLIIVRNDGDVATDLVVTKTGAPITITKLDGVSSASLGVSVQTVAAAATSQYIYTGLKTVTSVVVQTRSAAGAVKAYAGVVTVSGGTVFLAADASLIITDIITVIAFGVRG